MSVVLRSNKDNADLTIDSGVRMEYATDAGFESTIAIRYEHWDGDHTHPIAASVAGVWLRAADLKALCDHVGAWIQRPLDQLRPQGLDGEFELARLPGQIMTISFGERADTISEQKPVVSIVLAAAAFRCEFCFVTDQSCLTTFCQELSRFLR